MGSPVLSLWFERLPVDERLDIGTDGVATLRSLAPGTASDTAGVFATELEPGEQADVDAVVSGLASAPSVDTGPLHGPVIAVRAAGGSRLVPLSPSAWGSDNWTRTARELMLSILARARHRPVAAVRLSLRLVPPGPGGAGATAAFELHALGQRPTTLRLDESEFAVDEVVGGSRTNRWRSGRAMPVAGLVDGEGRYLDGISRSARLDPGTTAVAMFPSVLDATGAELVGSLQGWLDVEERAPGEVGFPTSRFKLESAPVPPAS